MDWERVAKIMEPIDREIFLSVECGTIDQAERSRHFLEKTLSEYRDPQALNMKLNKSS